MAAESVKIVVEDDGSHRFVCPVADCKATFKRKEHLTRHSKGHSSEISHVCSVCSRKFNRSDSLARHLSRHGENYKAPSSRSKSACLACHAAKIKCDGDKQCQTCVKKGIECRYRSDDVDPMQLDGDSSTSQTDSSPNSNGTPSSQSSVSVQQIPSPRSEAYVNWSSIRIQSDEEANKPPFSTPHLHYYFDHFHHRFPIVHRPSYIGETKGRAFHLLTASMDMIGAWIEGSAKSKEYAIAAHQELARQCLLDISNITSEDVYQGSLSAGLCQATLLNVIFVIYCGRASFVSRGLILHNMLITALREVGFFNPHTIWSDEKPGCFLPFHLLKMGERTMLAENLFKVDVYLSLARGNSQILAAEELIYMVPSSFSLWNSNGLDTWEQRLDKQPIFRMERTMYEMVNSTLDFAEMVKSHLLWEDVHLCLAYFQAKLWRMHTLMRNTNGPSADTNLCKEIITKQLANLKVHIDQMALCPGMPPHYYGFEDHTDPSTLPIIEARCETLRFDTIFLYHLINIHLYADVSALSHVAKEFSLDLSKYTEEQQHKIGGRRCAKAAIIASPDQRRALTHAVHILSMFQTLSTKPDSQKAGLDPVAYIALASATLMIWVHVSFGVYSCESCAIKMGYEFPETVLELGPSSLSPFANEEWVQSGHLMRVTIDGVDICMCKYGELMTKMKSFFPVGEWELADSIAPGVWATAPDVKIDQLDWPLR